MAVIINTSMVLLNLSFCLPRFLYLQGLSAYGPGFLTAHCRDVLTYEREMGKHLLIKTDTCSQETAGLTWLNFLTRMISIAPIRVLFFIIRNIRVSGFFS